MQVVLPTGRALGLAFWKFAIIAVLVGLTWAMLGPFLSLLGYWVVDRLVGELVGLEKGC